MPRRPIYAVANAVSTVTATGSSGTSQFTIAPVGVNTATWSSIGFNGVLKMIKPSGANCKPFFGQFANTTGTSTNHIATTTFAGVCRDTTSAINALRFAFSSGNIESGVIRLYGVKKAPSKTPVARPAVFLSVEQRA